MTSEKRKPPEDTVYPGHSVDVSRGGSLIRGPIPLEAGSGLELRINLGEFTLAPVEGKVSRSHPSVRRAGKKH